jgi:hypothetical protein
MDVSDDRGEDFGGADGQAAGIDELLSGLRATADAEPA